MNALKEKAGVIDLAIMIARDGLNFLYTVNERNIALKMTASHRRSCSLEIALDHSTVKIRDRGPPGPKDTAPHQL